MSNIIGNRNSTPETSLSGSTLRPPRTLGSGHHLRASADMGAFSASSLANRGIRPASEVYLHQVSQGANAGNAEDAAEMAAQQWIADIDQYETTLEEMAAATLDQDFKDELSAIEQWFRVLSEPERTAALYALLQQTTQVQIRFFIQVLQQMAKSHPMSGVLSPAAFGEKDAMSSRLSDAMSKLNVEGSRNSFGFGGKPPPSPGAKRTSGLDANTIKSMFPDAANAIEDQKAEFQKTTGNAPTSNRNSAVGDRVSQYMPTISGVEEESKRAGMSNIPSGPWRNAGVSENQPPIGRPKSSSSQQPQGQPPMGQFGMSQPPPSAGLRTSRPSALFLDNNAIASGLPPPLTPGARWADTPKVDSFGAAAAVAASQADVIRNVTATKLGAFTTIENRNLLDNGHNFRRARSQEGRNAVQLQPGMPTDMLMMNDPTHQYLTPQQVNALQAQRLAVVHSGTSRPNSPGIAIIGPPPMLNGPGMPMTSNGLLTTYDPNMGAYNMNLMPSNLSAYSMAGVADGYLSGDSDINRGRSPRGRRGSSKPPEDPTDPALLKDIPNWLRTLRLHKYTDNLKDMKWQDLVQLDDEGLEKRGVAAKGARTKLLKVFEQVREIHQTST